jgi:hypothetical protein
MQDDNVMYDLRTPINKAATALDYLPPLETINH